MPAGETLAELAARIRACRLCVEAPAGKALPHQPHPVLRESPTAPILIAGQAPGIRVHHSGLPFTDPSGDRLRHWLGVDKAQFYDTNRFAVVPMGFCFPGHDAKGGDLPPRRECAAVWHAALFERMPQIRLIVCVGWPAIRWHMHRLGLGGLIGADLTTTVADWRRICTVDGPVRLFPLPHPSWRNSGWLKRNPWFEQELLPVLRSEIA